MISKEEVLLFDRYENKILDVVYHRDDFTTSDLQGTIGAIVMEIYNEGKKAAK